MEKKLVLVIFILFIASQVLIFGSMFASGVLRFEISTPENSEIFDIQTVIENESKMKRDTLATQNYYSYETLTNKEKELKLKEEKLLELERRLDIHSKDLSERERKIEGDKKRIEELVIETKALEKTKEGLRNKKLKKLARIYANMEPAEAAKFLHALDNQTAIDILIRMNPENAGPIMDNLKTTKKGTAITNAALSKLKK